MIALKLFAALLIGHALADYPLQGDFLAKAKNRTAPIPGTDWEIALSAHAAIQAGFVWLLTGSAVIGTGEFVIHFLIDFSKCDGVTTFAEDQFAHVFCKAAWVGVVAATCRHAGVPMGVWWAR